MKVSADEGLMVGDDAVFGALCNQYLAIILADDDDDASDADGVAIGVPGRVWADRYVAVRVMEQGAEIFDEDGNRRDSIEVCLSVEKAHELARLLIRATDVLAARDANPDRESAYLDEWMAQTDPPPSAEAKP